MNSRVTLGVTDQMEVLSGPADLRTSVTVAGWVTPVQTLLSISTKAASALRYFIPRQGTFRLLLREMRGGDVPSACGGWTRSTRPVSLSTSRALLP